MTTRHQKKKIVTVGELPQLVSVDEHIKHRILNLVSAKSDDWQERRKVDSWRWHWWILRSRIGGHVKADTFRRLIDELEEDGHLIEVWDWTHPRKQAAHFVLCPKHFHKHNWNRIVKARGREDVLDDLGLNRISRKSLNW